MKYFFIGIFGIIIGSVTAVYRISHWDNSDATIVNGVWKAHRLMNLGEDHLLTARIATGATFALQPKEVIYMIADKDSDGNVISSAHDYVIEGKKADMATRYWSITMYGKDHYLVPNEAKIFSYNMANVNYNTEGAFQIQISASPQNLNWLPSGTDDQVYLLLRLYHPEKRIYEHIDDTPLPVVRRISKDNNLQ